MWIAISLGVLALGAVVWWLIRNRPAGDGPNRGEIWWADVPFADGSGSKVRPCLILRRRRRGVLVLKITSQDKSHRGDHVRIPTQGWDPRAEHDSYLNVTEPILVSPAAFERRAGSVDAKVMKKLAS